MENIRARIDVFRVKLQEENPNWQFDTDIRFRVFNQAYRLLLSYGLSLKFLNDIHRCPEQLVNLLALQSLSQASEVTSDLNTFYKNGFIYNFCSIIESFLRSIFEDLGLGERHKVRFYKLMKIVYKKLGRSEGDTSWVAIMILFNIRNCVHNNGVFTADSADRAKVVFNYHGVPIVFVHGSPQGNATDEMLHSLTLDIINFLQQVVYLPMIKIIPHMKDITIINEDKLNNA